jgi:hypothetical protein
MIKEIVLLIILVAILMFPLSYFANVPVMNALKALIIWGIFLLYNHLTKDIKDNFHFELTPEKKCEGGSYMWSSSPEKQALCSKFSKEQLARYECPAGLYNGRPIWRQGAGNIPLSDDNWQNTTCKQIGDNLPDPQVL